jgi:hypothetical protein
MSVVVTSGCPAPGEGRTADRGLLRAEAVLQALERFEERNGAYPQTLEALVPEYIDLDSAEVRVAAQREYPLEYTRMSEGFELSFDYTGPGMNTCTFSSTEGEWFCRGHF